MTEACIRRLRLQGAPTPRPAARVEDAFRLAPDGGGRLLVLRRMDLGRARGADLARLLPDRAAAALREAALRAVHGGAPHAPAAGAVWFRSVEEARRLLLLLLLRGGRADAWFWRLAVPTPPGGPAAPALIAAALAVARAAPPAEASLARLVAAAAAAGRLSALLALAPPEPAAPAPDLAAPPAPSAETVAAAEALLAAAPPPLGAALRAALAPGPDGAPAPLWLRRAAVIALAPGALAAPARLATLAAAIARPRPAAAPAATPPRGPQTPAAAPPSPPADTARGTPSPPPAAPMSRAPDTAADTAASTAGDTAAAPHAAPETPAATPPAPLPAEAASAVAGVFLTLIPLRRLGFSTWLAAHPDLALAGFGPALLRHVAFYSGAEVDDPALPLLPDTDRPDAPLALWRRTVDRWLRRRARRRLAEIAARPGWITAGEDRIDLRYPLAAADLRLRRLALDADPGWTPWLGRAVHFHFRDEAL